MAAGNTYVALATNTLSSAAASVTFSSISGSYTDLICIVDNLTAPSANSTFIQIGNGSVDTGSNYSYTYLLGNGSAASSSRQSSQSNIVVGNIYQGLSNTVPTMVIIHLMNYANTTTYKTIISRDTDRSGAGSTSLLAGLWRSTSAINTLKVFTGSTYNTGATFTLYGIAAA